MSDEKRGNAMRDGVLHPNPDKAREVLDAAAKTWNDRDTDKVDLFCAIADALGWLRGYCLSQDRWLAYRCTVCGVHGVKLWRAAHSDSEAWCSACGCAQAGLTDEVDDEGRRPSELSCGLDRKSDQIYSPKQGCCLLPYVPAPDGGTWGYTSVPPEGCHWWRLLPTRKKEGDE